MPARWTSPRSAPSSKTPCPRPNKRPKPAVSCAYTQGNQGFSPPIRRIYRKLRPMRYGEGLLEEIRRRTDLVQLVGRRVKLVRKGWVMWGCCPFHAEKFPSFKVENERRTYKCFGCAKGGDCFKWLVETEGLSFPESVEKLAAEVGVELPKWSPDDEAREQKRKSLYDIVELAAKFYEAQLFEPAGKQARDYLKGRGLDA